MVFYFFSVELTSGVNGIAKSVREAGLSNLDFVSSGCLAL